MKVLLDECLPKKLKYEFIGHDAFMVRDLKLLGKKNGALLHETEKLGFEVFVTIDGNLRHQQNLQNFNLIIVGLSAVSNEFENLKPIIPKVLKQLSRLKSGRVYIFKV